MGKTADDYTKELFEDSIGCLQRHIDRKRALADETRYSLLYVIYKESNINEGELKEIFDFSEEELKDQIQPLVDVNLISRIPDPGGFDEYRITTLGSDEISSDINAIKTNTKD